MIRLGSMASLVSIVVAHGCQSDPSKTIGPCTSAGEDGHRTIGQGASAREYILYIPDSYEDSEPAPLLLNFHGFGACASEYAENIGGFYGLHSQAEAGGFIVAWPQGVVREKDAPEWDPGDNGSQDITQSDPFFAERLVAEISSELNVDASRVYAAGYSNGGMMAFGLACSRGDLIAAAGVMSGTMLGDVCDADVYSSIIQFHGIADDVLPYDGNEYYTSVAEIVDFWLGHNGVPASSLVSTTLNGGDVVHDAYSGGRQGTSVSLYTMHSEYGKEGGHVWFSENVDGRSPNGILWDFLSAHTLNGD